MRLEDFYFYSLLSDEGKALLKENLRPFSMQEQGILYYAGDVCEDILIIESGSVRVFVQGDGDVTYTLYALGADEPCIVNTFSTIFSSAAVANAEVESDLNGWLLNKKILLRLLADEPEYSAYLYATISKNFSALVGTIEDIKFTSVKERLEKWLFSQPTTHIKVTHEKIGQHLGSARPVISRLLKSIEDEGKIELQHGGIKVL